MEPSGTPTPPTQPDLTAALRRASSGSDEAVALLWSLTYEELRRMARGLARSESRHDDLQPTALVHDLWLRTFGADRPPAWDNRRHFFGSMARALQQHLIDACHRLIGVAGHVRAHSHEIAAPQMHADHVRPKMPALKIIDLRRQLQHGFERGEKMHRRCKQRMRRHEPIALD